MITVKCIGGADDGREIEMPSFLNPGSFLVNLVARGVEWEIDYSRASQTEIIRWGGADLAARAGRAIRNGRTVSFLGKEYKTWSGLSELEDALVHSGYEVQIARDDESGVEIAIVQPE